MNNPEQQNNPERKFETNESAKDRLETIGDRLESSAELIDDNEQTAEKARHEALETAVSVESGSSEREKQTSDQPAQVRRGRIDKKQLDKSYKQTIKRVQSELPITSRAFSKVIHNRVIESTSEFVGNTLARPNAILAGAISAFSLTLLVYTVSKSMGYLMSGFETIGAFIVGWAIGLTFDYLRILFTGKKY